MLYMCLKCDAFIQAVVAPVCATCQLQAAPYKLWAEYNTGTLYSITHFNPSCRAVSFDLHVSPSKNAIYVVAKCSITFAKGPTGTDWDTTRKSRFLKRIKAAVGLWDGRQTFTRTLTVGTAAYLAYHFIDEAPSGAHYNFTVNSSAAPQRLSDTDGLNDTNGMLLLPGGGIVVPKDKLGGMRGSPGHGTNRKIGGFLNEYAAHTGVKDTTVNPLVYANTVAHEWGHMIGLPDEYDAYPNTFNTANLGAGRVNRGGLNADKDKGVAYWVELLAQCGLASPAWGHAGDDSIMRNVATHAAAFRPRHHVTVLEGLQYLSAKTDLGGTWSM
ncbi:hypothetical protein POL68_38195 [Stigmatella sp. ncwal1]|uniref:Peptidase M10 metallopeptidase domain-containing protein n=1 Tax=Stigmatella ashevillensis TaxID=2995309 RepID=A0ABT5DL76_9BACT|nr:hypothetical protein [Stigmatella ashevillena]MDC0714349.1 hypothetical protein [Stigmatella ashevillena]